MIQTIQAPTNIISISSVLPTSVVLTYSSGVINIEALREKVITVNATKTTLAALYGWFQTWVEIGDNSDGVTGFVAVGGQASQHVPLNPAIINIPAGASVPVQNQTSIAWSIHSKYCVCYIRIPTAAQGNTNFWSNIIASLSGKA